MRIFKMTFCKIGLKVGKPCLPAPSKLQHLQQGCRYSQSREPPRFAEGHITVEIMNSRSELFFADQDFVTWKMVQAARKVPEQVAWDPSLAKREFLLEYVLQASPAGATLAGWAT